MTVSPYQSHDGHRQRPTVHTRPDYSVTPRQASPESSASRSDFQRGDSRGSNARHRQAGPRQTVELPPTLFSLPNLFRSSIPPKPVEAPTTATAEPTKPVMPDAPQWIPEEAEMRGEPLGTLPVVSPVTATPPPSSPRKWSERAAAQGLLLALLVAVVFAAVVVGRRSQNHSDRGAAAQADSFEPADLTDQVTFGEPEQILSVDHELGQRDDSVTSTAVLQTPTAVDPAESNTGSLDIPPSLSDEPVARTARALNPSATTGALAISTNGAQNTSRRPSLNEPSGDSAVNRSNYPTAIDLIGATEPQLASQFGTELGNPTTESPLSSSPMTSEREPNPAGFPISPTPNGIADWSRYFPTE